MPCRLQPLHAGLLVAGMTVPGAIAAGQEAPGTEAFFRARIEPVLENECYRCHSSTARRVRAGLRLDTFEDVRAGGVHGPIIVPGDPDASSLIVAMRYTDPAVVMPPDDKLDDAIIRDFEAWVRAGAFDPRGGSMTEADAEMTGAMMDDADAMTTSAPAHGIDPNDIRFFESKIRPVLIDHCYSCHSQEADRIRGGFVLDTRDGLLAGGPSGPAIVPGAPDDSLLLRALRYNDDDLAMPPNGPLDPSIIADFETWIARGAPDPRAGNESETFMPRAIDFDAAREFWSYRAPERHTPPTVADADWPRDPVDHFILAELEARNLRPVQDADKDALLRRLCFDLTGLPPTPEQVDAFRRDRRPGAVERLVDELLESSQFGERWGRHWLDVARYAESSGRELDLLYPHAWRYRDWVINALNDDVRYDDFLRAQIAGDLLPADDATDRANNLIATGYLAIGPKSHNAPNGVQFAVDVADEQIDAMSQGMLGLTISCARCHDHKFDPIPTRDYYAMAGIFLSTETHYGTDRVAGNRRPGSLITLPEDAAVSNGRDMTPAVRSSLERQRERADARATELQERMRTEGRDAVNAVQIRRLQQQVQQIDRLLARYDDDGEATDANRLAMGAREGARDRDVPVLIRGELSRPGDVVPRGFLQVLADVPAPPIRAGSGRLELADWIVSPQNPLTARVWVNRVWLHLFGEGIVPTPDNFGMSGLPPTHPELLDTLALDFMEQGWSTKELVRRLVLTRTYQLSARHNQRSAEYDPENTWRWRMTPKRLEGESIRDAMLAVAGLLETDRPIGSDVSTLAGNTRFAQRSVEVSGDPNVRSVYLPIMRGSLPEALEVFDAAPPEFVSGNREETNVPSQALFMLNSEEVTAASDAFAARLMREADDDVERLELAFVLALGREPTSRERTAVRQFFESFPAAQQADAPATPARRRLRDRIRQRQQPSTRELGWSAFCQSLFASAEFRYLP